jgi:hypothetical protein
MRIICFGDSLTAGYQLKPGQGFVPQLEAALRKQGRDVRVHNAGVSGEGRPGPVAAQPNAPQPKVSEVDPAAIVPNQPEKPRRADKKSRKDEREASAATPGFSL